MLVSLRLGLALLLLSARASDTIDDTSKGNYSDWPLQVVP